MAGAAACGLGTYGFVRFALAATARHLSMSSFNRASMASGGPGSASKPCSSKDCLTSGKVRTAVISRLNREITAILETAEMKETLVGQGIEPDPSTPADFGARIRSEIVKWRNVVKIAKVTGE